MQVPDIADLEGLDFKAFDPLGIDGLDEPAPAPLGKTKGLRAGVGCMLVLSGVSRCR